MQQQIQKVEEGITNKGSSDPVEQIRDGAKNIAVYAIDNFTGHLLKSAMTLSSTIAQFANDLECDGKEIESR